MASSPLAARLHTWLVVDTTNVKALIVSHEHVSLYTDDWQAARSRSQRCGERSGGTGSREEDTALHVDGLCLRSYQSRAKDKSNRELKWKSLKRMKRLLIERRKPVERMTGVGVDGGS